MRKVYVASGRDLGVMVIGMRKRFRKEGIEDSFLEIPRKLIREQSEEMRKEGEELRKLVKKLHELKKG